jgi:hypothetical protein
MKLRHLSLSAMALIGATVAQTTSAQVIIGFAAASVSPVPLSPWLTAAMALMLAVMGLVFVRQKTGRGLFLLMLSVLVGGGALLQTTDGNAAYGTPVLQALGVSGDELAGTNVAWMSPGPVCGPIGYVWVKSGAGTVSVSSIAYRIGYSALDPASPPAPTDVTLPTPVTPVCTVGTSLTEASSCIVWYKKDGPC